MDELGQLVDRPHPGRQGHHPHADLHRRSRLTAPAVAPLAACGVRGLVPLGACSSAPGAGPAGGRAGLRHGAPLRAGDRARTGPHGARRARRPRVGGAAHRDALRPRAPGAYDRPLHTVDGHDGTASTGSRDRHAPSMAPPGVTTSGLVASSTQVPGGAAARTRRLAPPRSGPARGGARAGLRARAGAPTGVSAGRCGVRARREQPVDERGVRRARVASHIRGNIETRREARHRVDSLTTTAPSAVQKKSTRASPSHSSASKARTATRRTSLDHLVGQVGGHVEPDVVSERYFASKS